CRPIPGDPIVGVIRKGQGLEVHLHDCPQAGKLRGEKDRWIDVEWEPGVDRLFDVTLKVVSQDARGVLAKVAGAIAQQDCNIENVSTETDRGPYSTIYLTVQVNQRGHLARVIRAVRRIPEVVRVGRTKGEIRQP
ncbi:MAG: bifunctional (p)ppGpp synthetase/guanosine-3',5'-bis(diphosphate) 3'-pyrophosphohydrolase, partial [Zoogloea sp.]|nr:bifunctional (p)ppGpp synthetase/guanosine-3',5'-bis(diphosphate) 3'-pyrophosphohydrolase [Zoogloea sp.]